MNFSTNLDATNVTLSYSLNNVPTETQGSVEACKQEPTPTPTDPPKESTPTSDPTDDPKPQVDPRPDVAAGGVGPSIGSLVMLLGISGASVSLVSYVALKIKNGQKLIN